MAHTKAITDIFGDSDSDSDDASGEDDLFAGLGGGDSDDD